MTRVLVCGGRDFRDAALLFSTLDEHHADRGFSVVIEGEQRGADRLARKWAEARGVPVLPFEAEWDTYGDAAGPIRNRRMLVEGKPDLVVAFPGGSGTDNMCRQANKRFVEVIRIRA